MKRDKCRKCGKYTFVYEHHILPQSQFGKNTETMNLCGNCHTDYHQHLGNKELKNPSIEFHYEKFFKWLMGLSVISLLVFGIIRLMG